MERISSYKNTYNDFTRDLLISFSKDKGNIVLSPYSILVLLCMAAESTDTETKEQILNIISKDRPYSETKDAISELTRELSKDPIMRVANALCVNAKIADTIKEDFKDNLTKDFDAKIFDSKNIVNDVNKWVSEKTKGMIKQIADPSVKNMLACLMNAVCFDAKWQEPYEEYDICEDDFTNYDGSVSEVTMMSSSEYGYIKNERLQGFVKPYKGNRYSFMALLPEKEPYDGLLDCLKDLDFSKLFKEKQNTEVRVDMPEFKHDFSKNLTEYLEKLGMEKIFTPSADFSPMTDEWVKAEGIIHKAHIEVDRKGTKAAAVTAMYAFAGCASFFEIPYIRLNRPFIYAIMNNETGLPVFAGITAKI